MYNNVRKSVPVMQLGTALSGKVPDPKTGVVRRNQLPSWRYCPEVTRTNDIYSVCMFSPCRGLIGKVPDRGRLDTEH